MIRKSKQIIPISIIHGPQRCLRPQKPVVNIAQHIPSKINKIWKFIYLSCNKWMQLKLLLKIIAAGKTIKIFITHIGNITIFISHSNIKYRNLILDFYLIIKWTNSVSWLNIILIINDWTKKLIWPITYYG